LPLEFVAAARFFQAGFFDFVFEVEFDFEVDFEVEFDPEFVLLLIL